MAGLRVRRSWWIVQQATHEPPLFRELSRRWRPVDRRERRMVPFALALSAHEAAKPGRASFTRKKIAVIAEAMKKSARTWNPWMMTK